MRKAYILIVMLLITCLIAAALLSAKDFYRISLSADDFKFLQDSGFTKIQGEKSFSLNKIGAPDLPIMGYKYYIPSDIEVTGIRIIDFRREKVDGRYDILPAQERNYIEKEPNFVSPNQAIYSSNNPYPGKIAEIGGVGYYRGHQIADVIVYPYEYIPSEKTLYFYSEIDFEFTTEAGQSYIPPVTKLDKTTIDLLKTMVENDYDVHEPVAVALKPGAMSEMETEDATPCVIITNASMYSKFIKYGIWKTRKGLKTEVKYISDIETLYPDSGMGTAGKIRNYIRDCYQDKGTEYVILGGDVNIIPGIHIKTCDRNVLTDQYYACLDNNWNENGDTIFADIRWYGDTVDYYPEVYVGRIPCRDQYEAQAFVDKAFAYQRDTTVIGYQSKALFTSSEIIVPNDGYDLFMAAVIDEFPTCFTKTNYYNAEPQTICNEIISGQGIFVNVGHSWGPENFATMRDEDLGQIKLIGYDFFDTVNTAGQYPVFFNFTCDNAKLDDTLEAPGIVSKSFMLNPNGGGVGFIASTDWDYPLVYDEYVRYMFEQLFDTNEVRLGKMIADAKMILIPQIGSRESYYRYASLSHMCLGDPQMEIWTETPTKLRVQIQPGFDTLGTEESSVEVRVLDEYDDPVPNAVVCLSKESPDVYEITTTQSYGYAVFNNISFETVGAATIVASKQNYFPYGDSIIVIDTVGSGGGSGGCPMLYIFDGMNYRLANNVLAKSEDPDIPYIDYDDYLPVFDIPVMDDGIIRLRVGEDENESSQIDELELKYISYPTDKRPVYTSKNEFRYLSSEYIAPVQAIDHRGNDVLKQILSFDGECYSSSEPGYLILSFSGIGGVRKIHGDDGGIPQPPGGKLDPPEKLAANDDYIHSKNIISISVINENDSWEEIDMVYPRLQAFNHIVDLSDKLGAKESKIRIEWTSEISIDCLPYYFYEGDPIKQIAISTTKAMHNSNGNVLSNMTSSDGEKTMLIPGEYIDFEFEPIVPYKYWENIAIAVKMHGKYEKMVDKDGTTATGISFEQNYPNPFNPATTFTFALPASNHVNLAIYNTLGRKVIELANKDYPAGKHQIFWNGNNSDGKATASGIYFARFKAGDYINTKKIVVVK